jgi:hypothetical protein
MAIFLVPRIYITDGENASCLVMAGTPEGTQAPMN